MIKKVNAIISQILMVCLLLHLSVMSYSMLTGWYDYSICKALAHLTAGVVSLHAIISVIIVFFLHDGADMRYGKRNIKTIFQRASAIIIAVILHSHIKAFGFIVQGITLSIADKAELLIVEIIFFGSLFVHFGVSFSKSFISLGIIRTEKAEKAAKRFALVLSILCMLMTTVALTLFVINWRVT